jgi:hypothetical protein
MDEKERLRRWRLVLGGDSEATIGAGLVGEDRSMDGVLTALYGGEKDSKNVGHGGSLPTSPAGSATSAHTSPRP